jgi:hypothetical protein
VQKILLKLDKGNDIFYNLNSSRIKIKRSGYNDYIYKNKQCTTLPIGGFQ